MSMVDVNKVSGILSRIFKDLNELTNELKPVAGIIKASGGRPLAECGASDKIKIAMSILEAHGVDVVSDVVS